SPPLDEARHAGGASVRFEVLGDRAPRCPTAIAQLLERLEHDGAHDAHGARLPRLTGRPHELTVFARFVPGAAAAPRLEQDAAELTDAIGAWRARRAQARRIPETDHAAQGGDERHVL